MGDVGDWSAILDALLAEVQEDASCKKLLADLQGYAVYAVTKNEADIRDTIKNRVKEACLKHLVFFVLSVPHQASVCQQITYINIYTLLDFSSFHFLFHYPNISPIYSALYIYIYSYIYIYPNICGIQGQKLAGGCLWSSGSRSCLARLEQEVFIMQSRSSREPSHHSFLDSLEVAS